jgi:hypothetical protein
MTTYSLCGGKGCCPVVEVGADIVRIGEEGNVVELKKNEWDALVRKIRGGEIG